MQTRELNENLRNLLNISEDQEYESDLLNKLEQLCKEKGFSYNKYADSIVIDSFDFKDGFGGNIPNLSIYEDGSIEINNNGPLSLIPKDFDQIIDLLELINEYL